LYYLDKTCQRIFERTAERIITYDSLPRDVALGDFNRDNHTDLVIANSGIDNIGIRLGNGNRTFADQITYPTGLGSRPYWVEIGDFNNDTLLDIVVANYGTNNIGLFLGFGNGSFANQSTFSLNFSRPLSIAINDFNNDSQSDIVVSNDGSFYITVLLGFGNGSFQIDMNYYMGHDSAPCSIAVADFNNDSQPDIATVNYGTSELAILLSTENGLFSIDKYSTGDGSHPTSVTIGHFNNDHLMDIAIANSATHNIGVFLGSKDGRFTPIITISTKSNSYLQSIATGYFNNDNYLDIIVANSGENTIIVFEGYGNGSFSIATIESTGYNSNPCAIAVGNFDKDESSDIVVVNNGINYILVLTSYAFHTTANQSTYSTGTGSYPNSIAVGDFNNDSHRDIAVANTYGANIGIFFGYGNGAFTDQDILPTIDYSYYPYSITIGDFNKDKQLDIAAGMILSNQVHFYLGQDDGLFKYGETYSVGENSYPYLIASADFNNDTNLDLVTANCDDNNVAVLLGYGDGTFSNATYYTTKDYSCPIFVSVGDFNGDGLVDLVSANYFGITLSIFLNNGNGTFQNSIFISTGNYNPFWIVVGDLNNDTHQDIVLTHPDYSSISILGGYGNGTFENIYTYLIDIGVVPWSVILGNFNKDTKIDIAVANAADSSIYIFYGRGDGNFDFPDTILIEDVSYTFCMASGDFNNDNQVDIVVGNVGTNDISVLLLQYRATFGNQSIYRQGSGAHPFSVATGDFNNDNQTDIVVANSGTDDIQILIGYNNGTFMNTITYSTGINSHP
jgi:hypothetical protein